MASQLEEHRIVDIETGQLVSRYLRTIGRNSHLGSHGDGPTNPIATIRTDQGGVGWGLIRGPVDTFSDLIGKSITELFDPETGITDEAALPLDFALHDLAGVILDKPVHRILGSHGDSTVPCYDGAIYLDDLDPEHAPQGLEAVLRNCARDYELGYRAFKLKIGRGYRWMDGKSGLKRDIEVTRAVRDDYPECHILVDANNGYTGKGFLQYLDSVSDCSLFWVEEPFQETREDLRELRLYLDLHSSQTLIADGELHPDVPFLLELVSERLLDVLLVDVLSFGLTGWRHLMPKLHASDAFASPHAWGTPLKTFYTAHIAAGLGNVVTVEGVPGEADAIDTSGYRLENGLLKVPDAPGFGIEPPR